MPSRSSGFDLQQRENSQELHDKLTNILERFEETHQAIKENVRMLENVSDSTTAIGSSAATGSDTIDSSLSYPYSFGKHSRSASNHRLSGMDASANTNYGLRTISSVDSGVMLTLTSCSETGTQSRSRSYGSWAGGASPGFLTPGVEEGDMIQQSGTREQQQRDDKACSMDAHRSPSDAGSSEEEVFSATQYNEHDESDTKLRDRTDGSQINPNSLLSPMNRLHLECQGCGYTDSSSEDYEADEERFEVQENSIVFDEGDDNSYQVVSLPIAMTYTDGIGGHTDEGISPNYAIYSSNTDSGEPRCCIVLPPVHKERSSREVVSFLPPKEGRWMRKEFRTETGFAKNMEAGQTEGDTEHSKYLERSASTDSRLMFSPIPEESLSDWVPSSPSRTRKSFQHQAPPGPSKTQTVAEIHHVPGSSCRSPHAPAFQSTPQSSREQEEDLTQKLKKYRHRRKKPPTIQQAKMNKVHRPLCSSTSSCSSAIETSQVSDVVSLSSYRNAIDRQPVIMPQVLKPRPRSPVFDSTSSSSSLSYDDQIISSSSSCSDSEYDYQVSLQNHQHHSRRSFKPFTDSPSIGREKKTHAPVLRKMSKDKTKIKLKSHTSQEMATQKARLFKRNSVSPKSNRSKSLKTKSDEASHSLLRYFRFPSPPRTTAEEHSDSSQSKSNDGCRRKVTGSADRSKEPDSPVSNKESLPHASFSALEKRQKPSSMCSCANTSSSDTVSEIAYPGLQSKKTTNFTPQSKVEAVLQSKQNNALQSGQNEATSAANLTVPTDTSNQQLQDGLETEFRQAANGSPQALNTKMQHTQPQVATVASYALPAQQSRKKESCCSFLNRLFRRKKNKQQDTYFREYAEDPRLTLDLAGGEVRVKTHEPTEARLGGSPYVLVPHSESMEQLQRYDSHLYKYHPMPQRYYNYDSSGIVQPAEPYQNRQPIFVVPRDKPRYTPVVHSYQQHHRHRNMLYPYDYIATDSNQIEDNPNYYLHASQRLRPKEYMGLYNKRDDYQTSYRDYSDGYRARDELLRPFDSSNLLMMKPTVRPYQDHRLKMLNPQQPPMLMKYRKHLQML
ncbi:serine-rich adhesin for platelets-like [Watersipora subatra]|uniref:serine-rich adhesin for platelets-like n=1 Tax=Watersipora subatra TaxID=2589382 RepID=UPI00355C71CF